MAKRPSPAASSVRLGFSSKTSRFGAAIASPWSNNGSPMVRIRSTLILNPSRGRCLQYGAYGRDRRLEEWGSMVTPLTPHVRFGSKADISACPRDVRFTPVKVRVRQDVDL